MSGKMDLSSLPPEVRRRVEAGLAKLPPEARRQWEEQGSPLLAKLVSGLAGNAAAPRSPPPVPKATSAPGSPGRPAESAARTTTGNVSPPRAPESGGSSLIRRNPPQGHYNDTIAPGDSPSFLRWLLIGAVVAGAGAWWLL